MTTDRRRRKRIYLEVVTGALSEDLIPKVFIGAWQPPHDDLVGMEISYLSCFISHESHQSISIPLEEFLKAHAVCPSCGAPAHSFLDHNRCPCMTQLRTYCDFPLLILGEDNVQSFDVLWERSRKGERAILRNAHKGGIPKGLKEILLEVQSSRCYYCVSPIERTKSPADHQVHVDHLDAYENSSLSNLVCSCRRCNLNKGRTNAERFARSVGLTMTPEGLAERKALWTAVKRWRNTKAGKFWASKFSGSL